MSRLMTCPALLKLYYIDRVICDSIRDYVRDTAKDPVTGRARESGHFFGGF